MTGIITSIPPLVELPPGNSSSNPAGLPGVTYSAAIPVLAQTWSGLQTFKNGSVQFAGSTSGNTFLNATAIASGTLLLPSVATTDTLLSNNNTATVTGKSMDGLQNTFTNLPASSFGSTTGTGPVVLQTGASIINPSISGATITTSTYNGNIWSAGTGTLTLGASKTATISNTLTLAGTDGTTVTFQGTDTYVGRATTDTLTNKTFDTFGAGNIFRINGTAINAITGTGAAVLASSPVLVAPNLGTPSAATLTNATGLPVGTGISGLATGISAFLATPSSANLFSALTTKTGTGSAVFGTAPNITAPTGILKGDVGLGNVANVDTTNAANITVGTLPAARLPTPSATTLGGVQSLAAVASNWINTISTSGVASATQPAFTDISGSIAAGQIPSNVVTNSMSAQMAAYTLKGNATGLTANATDINIATLTSKPSPISADIVLIQDSAASNAFKRTTVGALASAGSVASYEGRTGAVVAIPADRINLGAVGVVKTQSFTTSGTYTPSAGLLYAIVRVVGGGGGGGGCGATGAGTFAMAGGGGGAGYAESILSAATIGASQTITRGAGGAGGVGAATGSTGGSSSFGVLVVATGGIGGLQGVPSSSQGTALGGAGGSATAGAISLVGAAGSFGLTMYPNAGVPGSGGASAGYGSGGGVTAVFGGTGVTPAGYGGGGGGASINASTAATNGGAGAPGRIDIYEFCNQ